jgi:hypothetical protein
MVKYPKSLEKLYAVAVSLWTENYAVTIIVYVLCLVLFVVLTIGIANLSTTQSPNTSISQRDTTNLLEAATSIRDAALGAGKELKPENSTVTVMGAFSCNLIAKQCTYLDKWRLPE